MKKRLLLPFAFFGILSLLVNSKTHGQTPDCRSIEVFGNAQREIILRQINDSISGQEYRISKRKTLIIKNARSISFSGCEATLEVEVKLKRKIRRDANGIITVKGTVSEANFTGRRVCISNARIDKLKLSKTLRIGEALYKRVANRVFPSDRCFDLQNN